MTDIRRERIPLLCSTVGKTALAKGWGGGGGGYEEYNIICVKLFLRFYVYFLLLILPPEGRPGMSDVPLLSGISGLSFDAPFLSPLVFSA